MSENSTKIVQNNISKIEGVELPFGYIDITLYRDDLSEKDKMVSAGECSFPCDIRDKTVIIVDDVMYTGRTARAAIEATFSYARPKELQYAVLIDRGHRELPIRPDYVGKNLPTAKTEIVKVCLSSIDDETAVYIKDKNDRD